MSGVHGEEILELPGGGFGLLTRPEADTPRRIAVLIPNTGVDSHVGPGRFHVELARRLAALGHPVLRLDLLGLGDAAAPPESAPPTLAAELAQALDSLDARGLGPGFALLGFGPGGAHAAHVAALADRRVVAAAFVDGYRFPTVRHWLNLGAARLKGDAPGAELADDPRRDLTPRAGDALHDVPTREIWFHAPPNQSRMQAELVQFLERRLALCYLYTGQVASEVSYAKQLVDAFPVLRGYAGLTLGYLPDADHRCSRRAIRDTLAELLRDWLAKLPLPAARA